MAHDEIVLASHLLQAVPWKVRDRPELEEMRRITHIAGSHLEDPTKYWDMYEGYNPNFWDGECLAPYTPDMDIFPRYRVTEDFVREQIAKRGSVTLLDIGVFDGQITNRIAKATGAKCWGVDCSNGPELANRYAQMFGTGAQFGKCRFGVDGLPANFPDKYDIVLCMEVYEHVPDTRKLLQSAVELVSPGGFLVLTTPHGSWFGGLQTSDYIRFDEPKPREHVRAPTLQDVASDLDSVGWEPVEQKIIPVQVSNRATMFVAARAKPSSPSAR
jgi:SAM-dependent methyltransferase